MKSFLMFLGVCMSLFMSSCQKNSRQLDKREQNLRFNLQKEPVSLDPRKGNDWVASQLHFMLFEGLLKLNSDMSLSPAQAKAYEVSSDGKTYTFYLADTKWSDGTPVTAYDFEKSWKSLLDPEFATPDAYLLYAVKNAKRAKQGEVTLNEVGIHAKDPKTLIVKLETPAAHFTQIVASSVLLPVNSRMEERYPNWARNPQQFISNGPFRLADWKFNQELIFEKNPYFREAHEVKLDHIFVEIIDREMAALHMYASGHFDLIGAPLSFFPAMIHQDLDKKNLLKFFQVASTKFLSFNTAAFPFNNVNIRRAFALAINRKAIVEHITQLNEEEALNIIPPILLSEKPSPLFEDADIALAKKCLAQGLEELKVQARDLAPLSFMYVGTEINHMIAQELQSRWLKMLGVQINLENVEFKTLHERAKKADYSIGVFSWVADFGDPMNILERFQDKTNHRNYSKWQNEDYNLILQRAMQASNPQEYLAAIQEAERFLIREMPVTGLFHNNYIFMIQPYVKGFDISPLGHIYFEKLSLESKK